MSIAILDSPPKVSDFTPLSEHEAATPQSFFGAKAVLHAHLENCDVLFSKSAVSQESFKPFLDDQNDPNGDGTQNVEREGLLRRSTGVFVTSEALILSSSNSTTNKAAISIPYPAISLHATQSLSKATSPPYYSHDPQLPNGNDAPESSEGVSADVHSVSAVYLQIDPLFSSRSNMNPDEDDGDDGLEIQIIPTKDSNTEDGTATPAPSNTTAARSIFDALSRCADLHPDPQDDEDEEGGGMPAAFGGMPGEGGWITSENMHEFDFEDADEDAEQDDGTSESLGPGAGSRRNREEGQDGEGIVDGADEDVEGTKWQRTG